MASASFYVLINQLHGNYGYLTLFNFTFVGSLTPYPADIVISHKAGDYLIPYALLLENIIFHSHSVIYVLSAYLLWLKRDQIKVDVNSYCLLGIPFVFNITHMLLFPTTHYRFLVFSISLILVWSLDLLGKPGGHEKTVRLTENSSLGSQ